MENGSFDRIVDLFTTMPGTLEARADSVPEGDEGDGEEDAEPEADRQGGLRDDVARRQRIQASYKVV